MLTVLIVDDEPFCCHVLITLLEKYVPHVRIVSSCSSAIEAMEAIQAHKPDVVFLDVEMPRMNGFQMLEQLPTINFDIIFTTSYDQYALKAIRFSAIDYLLKPIDYEELQKAVEKVMLRKQAPLVEQIKILMQKIKPSTAVNKVALPTMEGLLMISIDSIISCESDSNYTSILLKGKQKIVVSRTLKEIEALLEDYPFLRVHHSFLVNLNEINKYVKGEGGYLIMNDGSSVDVSRSRKESLLKKLLNNH